MFSYFVSHGWGIPMMKITGLSHLFKWENLHNWWLTKYFFAPLYLYILHSSLETEVRSALKGGDGAKERVERGRRERESKVMYRLWLWGASLRIDQRVRCID